MICGKKDFGIRNLSLTDIKMRAEQVDAHLENLKRCWGVEDREEMKGLRNFNFASVPF